MKNFIEKKIRFNVVILYLIVIAACILAVLYLFNLHEDIEKQKEKIQMQNNSLLTTQELILKVNQVQTNTAEYISTLQKSSLDQLKESLAEVEDIINTFAKYTKSTTQDSLLQEIAPLLYQQTDIILNIASNLNKDNPIEVISAKIKNYEDEKELKKDSLPTQTTIIDTIIHVTKPKGLLSFLSSKKITDTIISVRNVPIDTLDIVKPDTTSILSEVSGIASQASKDYIQSKKKIRRQINILILTYKKISTQISSLLLGLYQETLNSTISEIETIQKSIKEHYQASIMVAIGSFLLSLILVIQTVRNTNKVYSSRLALEQANTLNKQIMESRHKLLLSVSHDIKTPLGTILGNLELINNHKKEIISIQNASKHILALLENLLDFSSMEQGELQLSNRTFNLSRLIDETADMFVPLALQKNLSFNYHSEINRKINTHSDALKIKQVIINILSNAIKYTIDGGITFSAKYEEGELFLIISDSGVGIPKEEQKRIFEPYARVESNNSLAEGSGLGMYVVKGLINLLKGDIEIESVLGEGTKITVKIPIAETESIITSHAKSILVIDDDISFLSVVCSMLRKLGHTVISCTKLDEFKALAKQTDKYELVLTDMEMLTFLGTDVLKIVKEINKDIPVFVMSAKSKGFSGTVASQLGFDAHLQKPVTINSLQECLGGTTKIDCGFQLLEEMFEGDKESIDKILKAFISSTQENICTLEESIEQDNFTSAQAICHKMLTMFIQLEATEAVVILKEIDSKRGATTYDFPEWKEKTTELIGHAKVLIKKIETI